MRRFRAAKCEFSILRNENVSDVIYPYIRDSKGTSYMYLPSPLHGRSFVVSKKGEYYVVSKGNGLSYTEHTFINTEELATDSWGLLLRDYAIRDFELCHDVKDLGIVTNEMQYVIELSPWCLVNGQNEKIHPCLLQYLVKCPYRIEDAPFIPYSIIQSEVKKWNKLNIKAHNQAYLIAAEVIANNLRLMHEHKILHNAISINNYTWALELLDFELSCSPSHPYSEEYSRMQAESLFGREIIYAYQIILYIAGVLNERVDFHKIDRIFLENGFEISRFLVNYEK